jgi:tRNA(Ile)-lysidine synthase TilS/MesJ
VCKLASVEWREDATNTDVSRLRAAVRHRVAPVLRELRPDVGRRAMAAAAHADAATARLARSARALMRQGEWTDNAGEWPRPTLRKRDPLVLGALLRQARRKLCGRAGEDRVSKRALDAAVRAIQDRTTDPRRCVVGGMEVEVTARRVVVARR